MPPAAVARVVERVKKAKRAGAGWSGLCPAHDDSTESLSIGIGADGRCVINCHAGCEPSAVMAALGLSMSDLFSEPKAHPNGNGNGHAPGVTTRPRLVKTYDYTDADGALVFQACRFEPKTFRQRHRTSGGGWEWNLTGVTPVLYRLPAVLESVALGRTIWITEGEKDADALVALGLEATTAPMGAGKWRDEYAAPLAGAPVVVLPDNDEPGRAHAEAVAGSLTAVGCAVRVVQLPGLPAKGDVSDWLRQGGTVAGLEALARRTPIHGQPVRVRWRLDEVLADEELMRPPPPIVPYLAWASRSTLLAAREKSGKSTLAAYLTAAVSTGGDFLGEPCQQGTVLVVGLEEFIGDTARNLRRFGAHAEAVYLVDRLTRPPAERYHEIRSHLDAVTPVLVILDSLMAYSQGIVSDANDATQAQALVQQLTDLAHSSTVALLVIHHARKADGKYRGSSAIGGAVDVIAEIFPPEEYATTDPTRRRMTPVGRVSTRPVDYTYDGATFHRAGLDGEVRPSPEARILSVVRQSPGCTGTHVALTLGGQKQECLARIRSMIGRRALIDDGDSQGMRLRAPEPAVPHMGQ